MTIELTNQAKNKIRSLIKKGGIDSTDIRLISGCAGCGGLAVGMSIDEPNHNTDQTYIVEGITIYIEKESEEYIGNIKIDYADNEFGGNFILSNEYGSSVCFL